jgi:hypothetical protein
VCRDSGFGRRDFGVSSQLSGGNPQKDIASRGFAILSIGG